MRRILCVEDDKDSREVLMLTLQLANGDLCVEGASSGREAMELISAEPYDLYVLDLFMPEIDGAALCRWIRGTGSTSPIIFLSAAARDVEKELAFNAGADEYLIKPNGLDRVAGVVERYLDGAISCKGGRSPIAGGPLDE